MRLVALLGVLLLNACAFQLRGDVALPTSMRVTYIQYTGTDSQLLRTVARALRLSDVNVASDAATAGAILDIRSSSIARRVLLKDARGRARESEVSAAIAFRVVTVEGTEIVPAQTVERRNVVVLDPTDPLASSAEVTSAVESLREDAVWDMLRRIEAAAAAPADTATP